MSENERILRADTRAGVGAVAYDEGLRKYMLGVYNYMAMGVAATAVLSLVFMAIPGITNIFMGPVRFAPFIGLLAIGWFGPKFIFESRNAATAHGIYWAYVALWGLLIGPVVAVFTRPEMNMSVEVAKAFFISAAVFASVSLYGYTTKRDLSGWSRALMMVGVGLLVAVAFAWIFPGAISPLMSFGLSALIVVFMAAVTAFETQMIKNLYAAGQGAFNERASIFGAFALYGSFASMFINILNMLGLARE